MDARQNQDQLRDLLCLAVVADHVRWVLRGEGISDLVSWLAATAGQWRAWADAVALEMVDAGFAPDGRVRALASDIPFNWVPDGWLDLSEGQQLLSSRVGKVAGWARERSTEATSPEERDVLEEIAAGLEAQLAALNGLGPAKGAIPLAT